MPSSRERFRCSVHFNFSVCHLQLVYCSRTELTPAISLSSASSYIIDLDGTGLLQQHNTRQNIPHAHIPASCFHSCTLKEMTSPVNQAMLDAYVLMVLVMGTFFLYFCGMVWAFCNPKLSGAEEECETERQVVEYAMRASAAEELTRSTYVKFWDDTLWRRYCQTERQFTKRILGLLRTELEAVPLLEH